MVTAGNWLGTNEFLKRNKGRLGRNKFYSDDPEAHYNRGVALGLLGRYQEALAAFDQALALRPEYPECREAAARASFYWANTLAFQLGRYPEAVAAYERSVELQPRAVAVFNQAAVHLRRRQLKKAEESLQRALDLEASARGDKKLAGRCRAALARLRRAQRPLVWWDWWFTEGDWARRPVGGILLAALVFIAGSHLVTWNSDLLAQEGRHWWLVLGQSWETSLVPAAIILIVLLSPVLRRISTQGVDLEPAFRWPGAEIEVLQRIMAPLPSYGPISPGRDAPPA